MVVQVQVSLRTLFWVFFKAGLLTFGGGYAIIPLLETRVVEEKKWMLRDDFVEMMALCQIFPGAFALHCATFVGYRTRGIRGSLVALSGMVLPSFFVITFLASWLIAHGNDPFVVRIFGALIPVVVAVVGMTGLSMARKQSWHIREIFIAGVTAVMLFVLGWSPIWAILSAAGLGVLLYRNEKGGEPQ